MLYKCEKPKHCFKNYEEFCLKIQATHIVLAIHQNRTKEISGRNIKLDSMI